MRPSTVEGQYQCRAVLNRAPIHHWKKPSACRRPKTEIRCPPSTTYPRRAPLPSRRPRLLRRRLRRIAPRPQVGASQSRARRLPLLLLPRHLFRRRWPARHPRPLARHPRPLTRYRRPFARHPRPLTRRPHPLAPLLLRQLRPPRPRPSTRSPWSSHRRSCPSRRPAAHRRRPPPKHQPFTLGVPQLPAPSHPSVASAGACSGPWSPWSSG